MKSQDALRRISDVISRKKDAAAVFVPRKIAFALLDVVYPLSNHQDDSAYASIIDSAAYKAREKYLSLVAKGGYIGTIMSMPMVVSDDFVVCSMNEKELLEVSAKLELDLVEIKKDFARYKNSYQSA